MNLLIPGASTQYSMIDQSSTLWTRESNDPCPGLLSINHPLPDSWTEEGKQWGFPPSFHLPIGDNLDAFVKIEYMLLIQVKTMLHQRLSFLTQTNWYVPTISLLSSCLLAVYRFLLFMKNGRGRGVPISSHPHPFPLSNPTQRNG